MRPEDQAPVVPENPEELSIYRHAEAFKRGASLSGNEHNRLFVNHEGEDFRDFSGISGLDGSADGRSFALLDYDGDGWLDVALVNANAPLLALYRNEMGVLSPGDGGAIALRFEGANRRAEPAAGSSARDGYGARVEVSVAGRTLLREHRAGEGFAAQNSATLHIGIGDSSTVDSLVVRWPSGQVQRVGEIPSGSLVTVYEDATQSPGGTGFAWVSRPPEAMADRQPEPETLGRLDLPVEGEAPLRMFTAMATWCAACASEVPALQELREAFTAEELSMFGVPVDPADSEAMLKDWHAEYPAPYRLLTELSDADAKSVNDLIWKTLRAEALPATVVTDASGQVLDVAWGHPTISKLRRLAAGAGG